MGAPARTRIFKSGNSGAVRLPKDLAFPIGTEVEIVREGGTLKVRAVSETISGDGWMGMVPDLAPVSAGDRLFQDVARSWETTDWPDRDGRE